METALSIVQQKAYNRIEMEKQEDSLKQEITAAIKEELLAESLCQKAKQRVKDAKQNYRDFLQSYQNEISMPLLREMIRR